MFGSTSTKEMTYTHQLLPSLRQSMIVLLDRGFGAGTLLAAMAATRAEIPSG